MNSTTIYHQLLSDVLKNGVHQPDRTGTGRRSVFGRQVRFDLAKEFPLLTTKKVNFEAIKHELLWFLSGSTNIKYLHDHNIHIWDAWSDENGNLGPIYSKQWRSWPGVPHFIAGEDDYHVPFMGVEMKPIDQIINVVNSLCNNPTSRRHIVTAWNPAEIEQMALPPCHCLFQFYSEPDKDGGRRLSCQLYQRSADIFLGVN